MASHSANSTEESNVKPDGYDVKGQILDDKDARVDPNADKSESLEEDEKDSDSEKNDPLPCTEEEEEEQAIKAKYGRLKAKRLPLISKDQEHAFFDSADWALGKVGAQKSKGPLEALRPKLQPSPHHHIRSRRSTYASAADDGEGHHEGSNDSCAVSDEDQMKHGSSEDVHPNKPCPET